MTINFVYSFIVQWTLDRMSTTALKLTMATIDAGFPLYTMGTIGTEDTILAIID